MSKKGNIVIEMVSQKDLLNILKDYKNDIIRVGAAINPRNRSKQYERDGYSGKMFYAKTTNMKKAENTLLSNCDVNDACELNSHKKSNVVNKKGTVYIIKGKRSH